jgi:hypothetical protein
MARFFLKKTDQADNGLLCLGAQSNEIEVGRTITHNSKLNKKKPGPKSDTGLL